jgi:ABC-type antimicrobial peptide transport system permease subunit
MNSDKKGCPVFGDNYSYVLGTLIAIIFGRLIVGVSVFPIFYLFFVAVGISVCITLIASYFPARYATKLDPSTSLQDT